MICTTQLIITGKNRLILFFNTDFGFCWFTLCQRPWTSVSLVQFPSLSSDMSASALHLDGVHLFPFTGFKYPCYNTVKIYWENQRSYKSLVGVPLSFNYLPYFSHRVSGHFKDRQSSSHATFLNRFINQMDYCIQ